MCPIVFDFNTPRVEATQPHAPCMSYVIASGDWDSQSLPKLSLELLLSYILSSGKTLLFVHDKEL